MRFASFFLFFRLPLLVIVVVIGCCELWVCSRDAINVIVAFFCAVWQFLCVRVLFAFRMQSYGGRRRFSRALFSRSLSHPHSHSGDVKIIFCKNKENDERPSHFCVTEFTCSLAARPVFSGDITPHQAHTDSNIFLCSSAHARFLCREKCFFFLVGFDVEWSTHFFVAIVLLSHKQCDMHIIFVLARARHFFRYFTRFFRLRHCLPLLLFFFCFLTVSFTATKWEMAENEAENKNHIKWIIKIATIKKDSGVFSLSLFCLSHSLPGRYAQYSNVVFCTCAWPLNYFFLCACGVFLFV